MIHLQEEPFSILPMQTFCDTIQKSAGTIEDWPVNTINKSKESTTIKSS
jgi:hypothetical protein